MQLAAASLYRASQCDRELFFKLQALLPMLGDSYGEASQFSVEEGPDDGLRVVVPQ